MNLRKYLMYVLMVCSALILLSSCEDTLDEKAKKIIESDLLGSWEGVSFDQFVEVESSVEQDIFLMFSPGEGAINISGDLTESLTYIFAWGEAGSYSVFVGNSFLGEGDLPMYQLTLMSFTGMDPTLTLDVSLANSSTYHFESTDFVSTFDYSTTVLTISDVQLVADDSLTTITVGGQLQMKQVHIADNEKTQFNPFEGLGLEELALGQMIFRGDQMLDMVTENEEGSGMDTTQGYWDLSNNELTIARVYPDGSTSSEVMQLEIDGDELVMTVEGGCVDESDPQNCLSDFEAMFGFQAGSLTSFLMYQEMRYQKVN